MSSMQESTPEHNNVHIIVDYLRKGTPFEEVSSTTPSTILEPLQLNNQIKKVKKEKKDVNLPNQSPNEQLDTIQTLSSGCVKYGPIIVKPRKKPAKTIFTGRRSKNEVLNGEEEEKRQSRRERNRIAATKYRVTRENVLSKLEYEVQEKESVHQQLCELIEQLHQRKQELESLLSQPIINSSEPVQISSHTLELVADNQADFQLLLTNSSNTTDLNELRFDCQLQQQQQQQIEIHSSSLNRLLDECVPPIDANKNTNSILYNSAYTALSTCAQQYSSSGSNEDDSMSSNQRNSFVC